MKRILLTAVACAAALTGPAAMAAPAMAATRPPVRFHLGTCPGAGTADYGRGLSLGTGNRIVLSTKGNITFGWHDVKTPAQTHSDYGLTYFTHAGRYLRVDRTHAWLGTTRQVYAIVAGYGDGCGGPRRVHLGEANGRPGPFEWTAEGRTLRAEPHRVGAGSWVMHQVWAW